MPMHSAATRESQASPLEPAPRHTRGPQYDLHGSNGRRAGAERFRVMSLDVGEFREKLDRRPFCFSHNLANHPLFELPKLIALAESLQRDPHNTAYDAGDIKVEQRWNQRPRNPYTLRQALERLECAGAWVILKHSETSTEYRELMDLVLLDLEEVSGYALRKRIKNEEVQIMLASPGRITPYHVDNECNVLMQIRGEKDIFVFDQTDRQVLTDIELERFWVGDWNAGEYKARCQDRACAVRLVPGGGVHIPVNAPHWVKNDNNISVSLSINFEWRDESLYNVYRANYFLRKLGMQPAPPGRSPLRDGVKHTVMAAGFVPARTTSRNAVRFLRRMRHRLRWSISVPSR
jgi:hypothetical protein